MPGLSGLWIVLGLLSLIFILASVGRFVGLWQQINRKKYFRESFGEEPFPITEEKIAKVELRLSELLDGWRPWLSQMRTLKAEGKLGSQYWGVRKRSLKCLDETFTALCAASNCNYFCVLPYFDQFHQLIGWQKKGM